MVHSSKFEREIQIPAGAYDFIHFKIDSKNELLLFDIKVLQSSHRVDDIQIYLLDEQNYQNYVEYYKARISGTVSNHIRWTTYVQAKAAWVPLFFNSETIGRYYLVLDNLHSTITKKIIRVVGTSSSQPLQKLKKSKTSPQNNVLSGIDPDIVSVSKKLFDDGHYSQAIFEAVKLLEIEIKKKSKIEKIGESLANDVFNEQRPILKVNNLKTGVQVDEQRGFRYLFAGLFAGIKNPGSHSIEANDKSLAIEYLTFISLLLKKLKKSKLSKYSKTKKKSVSVLAGVGPLTTKKLGEMGIFTVEDLSKSASKEISKYTGIYDETSQRLIETAQNMLKIKK